MRTYLDIIETGLLLVPFVILALSIPFLLASYHRFGRVTIKRWVLVMSFFVYVFMVYCFAILPLPNVEDVANMTSAYTQLEPFYFLRLFFWKSGFAWRDISTYLAAMQTSYFYVPVLNIIFFLPFGVYLRYYFKQPLWKTVIFSFAVSLFIELTQLSGLYGIYPRPYRIFDVDDLILNTFGGIVGFVIAPLITWWLPTKDEILEQSYELGEKVSFIRRIVAILLDWVLIGIIELTIAVVTLVSFDVNITELPYFNYISYVMVIFFYFILLPYFWKGRTIGKWIVQIAMINDDFTKIKFSRLFLRQSIFYGVLFPCIRAFFQLASQDLTLLAQNPFQLISLLVTTIVTLSVVVNIFYIRTNDDNRLWYEKVTKTIEVSTIVNHEE